MGKISSGVFPVHENEFMVGIKGITALTDDDFKTIAQMETFEVSVDNGVETWNPMENKGWQDALITSKSMEIKLTGKRCIGDEGNDFCAGKLLAIGQDAYVPFKWVRPNGDTLMLSKAVIQIAGAGGDSTGVEPMEVTITSACKPEVIKAPAA